MLMPQLILSRERKHSSRLITKETAQFEGGIKMSEEEGKSEWPRSLEWQWRHEDAIQDERLQDLLMPGLRHAHTLQQLKSIDEYSPPGEYLINKPRLE